MHYLHELSGLQTLFCISYVFVKKPPWRFCAGKKYLTQLCFFITVLEFYCFLFKEKRKTSNVRFLRQITIIKNTDQLLRPKASSNTDEQE